MPVVKMALSLLILAAVLLFGSRQWAVSGPAAPIPCRGLPSCLLSTCGFGISPVSACSKSGALYDVYELEAPCEGRCYDGF